jgi:hypothetical protein
MLMNDKPDGARMPAQWGKPCSAERAVKGVGREVEVQGQWRLLLE